MKKIQISKIDAARRQILTAIRLYFNNADIVSTHTLAAVAYNITKNICDSNDQLPESFTAQITDYIKPKYKKLFWRKMNETANFFKHADRDPKDVHEFYPEQSENLLFLAIYQYLSLTQDNCPEIRLFSTWYMIHHPKSFNIPSEISSLNKDVFGYNKPQFYSQLLPIIQEFYR